MSLAVGNMPRSVAELAEVYLQAWSDHDLEGILALHTPDSAFWVHGGDGVMKWDGIDGCRVAFDYLLRLFPDQRFENKSLIVTDDYYIGHTMVTGTLALPWELGNRVYQPNGKTITFEIQDFMHCQGNRIRIKEGWIDGLAIHNQLTR
jgi:predicted ester cyclase